MFSLYYGPVVNPKTLTSYDALPRCLIAVGSDGNISWIENDIERSAVPNVIGLHGLQIGEYEFIDLTKKSCEFIMPGLIDTHVHACQFPNLGVGGDQELLDWLFDYVFPTEAKFGDMDYAEPAYNDVVSRSLACGTTTSCYYGSLYLETTKKLAEIVHKKGQRAFVGKCNMDWNCPGYYIDRTAKESFEDTVKLIEYIQSLSLSHANEPLVHPIITPRFALSCSDKLLTDLGELAARLPNVSIQTHVSENRKEVEEAKRRFDAESYTSVYDRYGLLRNNTILGHGVWLTEKEMKLIAERGAAVAHCPTSNFYLSSGMARVGLLLDYGVKVGLGTDVGGGYNPSILYTIQMASTASKMVAVQAEVEEERRKQQRTRRCCERWKRCKHECDCCEACDTCEAEEEDPDPETACRRRHHHCWEHHCADHHKPKPRPDQRPFSNRKLETDTLLYLATLGGAHVCSLPDRIGSFEVGKAFDALYVSLDNAYGNPAVWGAMVDEDERKPEDRNIRRWLERFLFTGDNRNIRKVWVQGMLVGGMEKDLPPKAGVRMASDENEGWLPVQGGM